MKEFCSLESLFSLTEFIYFGQFHGSLLKLLTNKLCREKKETQITRFIHTYEHSLNKHSEPNRIPCCNKGYIKVAVPNCLPFRLSKFIGTSIEHKNY